MLSITRRQDRSVSFWGMYALAPSRLATTLPSIRTSPPVGCSRPETMLKRVLLPQPLGPITATNSPGAAVKSIWSRAITSPPGVG